MKKIIILTLFFSQLLFAQLTVTEQQAAADAANQQLTLNLTVSAGLPDGFVLTAPAQFKFLPLAVKLNQKDLWLKKSETSAQLSSVIHWTVTEQGLVFLPADQQLSDGDQLEIRVIKTRMTRAVSGDSLLTVRSVDADLQMSDVVAASAVLSAQ